MPQEPARADLGRGFLARYQLSVRVKDEVLGGWSANRK